MATYTGLDGTTGTAFTVVAGGFTITSGAFTPSGGITDADLQLNSTNRMDFQIGVIDVLGLDDSAVSLAAAAATAAQNVFLRAVKGGAATGAGLAGASLSIGAGAGSDAAGTSADPGGAAGSLTIAAADGGAGAPTDGVGGNGGDVTITPGDGGAADGSGVDGDPGAMVLSGGIFRQSVQTIDMANSDVVLTLNPGTPAGTLLTSNILYVDANGGEVDLVLPPEADWSGGVIMVVNSGGEIIDVHNDADSEIAQVAANEVGWIFSDGTTLFEFVGVA